MTLEVTSTLCAVTSPLPGIAASGYCEDECIEVPQVSWEGGIDKYHSWRGGNSYCSTGFDRAQLIYTCKASRLELLWRLGSELDQELQRNLHISQESGGF